MPNYFKKIAIVILNYNGLEDSLNCLRSIFEMTYSHFITIVVDNASTIDPSNEIKKKFPQVLLIKNKENLGFAEGSNIGIKKALEEGCELVLLLNNDTIVDKNLLSAFIETLEKNPEGAILGGTILRFHQPDIIDHLGGMWDKEKAEFISLKTNQPLQETFSIQKVDYVCGCLMLIKKEVFKQIGFLEKDFFLLWEESDFCSRAKKKGFTILTTPKAKIWHKISASFTGGTIHSDYYWWRNRLFWLKRNFSLKDRLNIYFKIIFSEIYKLSKLTFLKSLEFYFLQLFFPSHLEEKKMLKLLRYKAKYRGIRDYFFNNLGKGPLWITQPKSHPLYLSFLKKQTSIKK